MTSTSTRWFQAGIRVLTAFLVLASVVLMPGNGNAQETAYTVGPSDVVELQVFGEPDLSRKTTVDDDGSIGVPLLGRVPVEGLTVQEIERLLRDRLADGFLVDPQVTVTVLEYHSRKVYVLGAVKEPGFFELSGPTTVLEVLSRAGGVLPEGGKSIVVVKAAAGATEGTSEESIQQADPDNTILIDGFKLLQEGDTSQNVFLSHLDVVYVPKAREVFVIGEVKNPGPVTYTETLTLLQAIGQAGGMTEVASKRVQLVRLVNGKKSNAKYHLGEIMSDSTLDVLLRPDDVIVVPKRIL